MLEPAQREELPTTLGWSVAEDMGSNPARCTKSLQPNSHLQGAQNLSSHLQFCVALSQSVVWYSIFYIVALCFSSFKTRQWLFLHRHSFEFKHVPFWSTWSSARDQQWPACAGLDYGQRWWLLYSHGADWTLFVWPCVFPNSQENRKTVGLTKDFWVHLTLAA